MKKLYKILTITLIIVGTLLINVPVFANDNATYETAYGITGKGRSIQVEGGGDSSIASGNLTTYDYVTKNSSIFASFNVINFDNVDPFLNGDGDPFFTGQSKTDLNMIAHTFLTDPKNHQKNCGHCSFKYNYVYKVGFFTGTVYYFEYLFTTNPIVLKDNQYYLIRGDGEYDQGYRSVRKSENRDWSYQTGGGVSTTIDGKRAYNLGADGSLKNHSLLVFYPFESEIDKIVDSNGYTFIDTGDHVGLKEGYRVQTQLERYSQYDPENYPKSTRLNRKTNWVKTPDVAYHDDNIAKKGGNKAFKGFYFNKIKSETLTVSLLEKGRYTYHLYLWRDGKWRATTVWSTKVLKFRRSTEYATGYVRAPTLSTQQKDYAVILDYETNTLSAVNDDNIFVSGAISNKTPYIISKNNFYIINDDLGVLTDNSSENRGSDTYDEVDNNIYDTNGENQGGGINQGGTYYPPNRFEPLPKPGEGANLFAWINYFIDNLDKVFKTIGEGIQSIGENVSSFFGLMSSVFSFIPSEIWTILTLGLSIIVVLRIFGR